LNWLSKFERNKKTNKLQLNKGIIKGKTIMITNKVKDIYDVSYIYVAKPIENSVKLKKTINIKKDMFKLKGNYDLKYWRNHEILTLTDEMQEFINMVNSSGKNSDFKTKTNME
jgi:hypothetical protein